ncbi:hypothetical protein [Lignipirellula cremea]|uniref:hypothetical protein n=1 Tax=Lignipirellula cremea TaxID=2528010 RepID=UPI0011A0FFDD|nr:hypothetical protein [Lignipirellula cremea]
MNQITAQMIKKPTTLWPPSGEAATASKLSMETVLFRKRKTGKRKNCEDESDGYRCPIEGQKTGLNKKPDQFHARNVMETRSPVKRWQKIFGIFFRATGIAVI